MKSSRKIDMWIISKWSIPPYIQGVIIYILLNESRENAKNEKKKKYCKNESDNNHTLSLNFFRIRWNTRRLIIKKCLALRAENGSYILNGPWTVSPSGNYKIAGASLTYQRGDRTRMESIIATGPLNESLKLEVSQELNSKLLSENNVK